MDSSGASGTTKVDQAEGSETTIEIKIKTLDSQTYTLRVNKQMPVPDLKAQIASVTGVLSEQQRLICRGKVLKDDQLLSAYHVEDGHTLHLVVRQPVPPSAEGITPQTGPNRSSTTHISPSVVIETFNVPDHGDGVPPEIGRIVSAVLGSFGISNFGSSTEVRSERFSTGGSAVNSTQQQSEPGLRVPASAFGLPTSISVGQPPVIPDSLLTMSQYLSHMRGEFENFGRGSGNTAESAAPPVTEGGDSNNIPQSDAVREGLPTPDSLAELVLSTRRLLTEQVGECLQLFAGQLENQANFTDRSIRTSTQSCAMRIGMLFHYLGAYILELGRTAMTLRLGHSPAESVVNAGPAIYISPMGPNPLMVQPLPFQTGTSIGNIPVGTVHLSSSLGSTGLGTSFLPRRIDIQIRRGSPTAVPNANREEHGDRQPPQSATRNTVNSPASENLEQSSSRATVGGGLAQAFAGESGVRVVPVRTMVAAVPASFSRMPSDPLSDSPSVRVQASVSRMTNSNSTAGESQSNQESGRQIPGSVYQFLSNLFPGGEIHLEEDSTIGVSTFPGSQDEESLDPPSTQEAEPGATGDAIFLSNLLHQIMPVISQHVGGADPSSARDRDSSSQAESSSNAGTSRRPSDTESGTPNSKRQKM